MNHAEERKQAFKELEKAAVPDTVLLTELAKTALLIEWGMASWAGYVPLIEPYPRVSPKVKVDAFAGEIQLTYPEHEGTVRVACVAVPGYVRWEHYRDGKLEDCYVVPVRVPQ